VDFDIINGNHYGALTSKVADDIKKKRREALGLEPSHDEILSRYGNLSGDRSAAAKTRRELQGGTVIVGRHSLKEYMAGLKRGWSEPLTQRDGEEELALTLSDDIFDDPAVPATNIEGQTDAVSHPTSPLLPQPSLTPNSNGPYSLFGPIRQSPTSKIASFSMSDIPPTVMPPQAPLGLVPFTDHLGFWQVPYMIYDFFTQRHRVLSGCKAGYAIVMGQTRPMTQTDLDFDIQSEHYIKADWKKLPKRIEDAKKDYYKDLKKNVKIARELAYGEREPTRAEKSHPPMTEVELRAQRLKKELKWKDDLEGWEILNGEVTWDDKFDGVLQIFDQGARSYE
jgi:mitochondrial import inner membrane translocase subunit TIM54